MRGLLLFLCLCIYAVDGFEDIETKKIEEFNNIELVRVNERKHSSDRQPFVNALLRGLPVLPYPQAFYVNI